MLYIWLTGRFRRRSSTRLFGRVLRLVLGRGTVFSGLPGPVFCPLFLLPLLVDGFLFIGEEGAYPGVRTPSDFPAGTAVDTAVSGGVALDTIQGDVAVDEDHLELEHLVLGEMELFFESF